MTMTIYTNNHIALDGNNTGWAVTQGADSTKVYKPNSNETLAMPAKRYALSTDAPDSGIPGRADFERDLRAALGAH